MPCSRATPRTSASRSRVHSDHSLCSAAIGWTATARRMEAALASDRPRYRTLPCCDQLGHRADGVLDRHLRVDPVLVVEVDHVDPQPAQAGLDPGADVLRPAVDVACRRRSCG